jgi:C_GCAxxG_C_C family probable redox protein
MKEEKIKEIVYRNYEEGFHCAESIANTINEIFSGKPELNCNAASGFCGGIGGCKEDVCGALSGGIIALGLKHGRRTGKEDISNLKSMSAELRQLFIQKFKTTVCKDVITNMQQMKGFESCKDVTVYTTISLYNLIKNQKIITS